MNKYIPFCPYCNNIAVIKPNTKNKYHRYVYVCDICGAQVAAHSCDLAPCGFPADKEISEMRYKTHKVFDDYLITHSDMSKSELYRQLATRFKIRAKSFHFGMLTLDELTKVYNYLCKKIKK